MAKDTDGLLLTASLDIDGTYKKIKEEDIAKLNAKLANDNSARVKIVGGLDLNKTQSLIQSQIATIGKNLKLNIGQINFKSIGNTQNITNGFNNIRTQANNITNSLINLANEFKKPIKPVLNAEGLIDAEKTIEKVQKRFSELGNISVKGIYGEKLGDDQLEKMIVNIKNAQNEVRTLTFQIGELSKGQKKLGNNDLFYLISGTSNNAGIEKFITATQKAQDKIKALRISLTADMKAIRSEWNDVNGGKSVKSAENIENLKLQYLKTSQAIRNLRNADDTTMASMKSNAEAQIQKLSQMVSQYHNAEKVATQLRAKGFETVKIDTGNNIDKFINSINNSKVPIQAMKTEIDNLTSSFSNLDNIEDQAGKSSALTNILNTLDNAKTKFQSLKELFKNSGNVNWLTVNSEQINKIDDMTTKLAIYKNNLVSAREEWKSQGLYVGAIQEKTVSLARSLSNIKKPDKFNEWVDEWTTLNQKATQLKTNLDSQVVTQNKIYEIQAKLVNLDPRKNAEEIAFLNSKLQTEQKELSNLQMQSKIYSNLISLEEQEKYITEQTAKAREQLAIANAKSNDKTTSQRISELNSYKNSLNDVITKLNVLSNSTIFTKNSSNPQVVQIKQQISQLLTEYQTLANTLQNGNLTPTDMQSAITRFQQLDTQFKQVSNSVREFKASMSSDNSMQRQAQQTELLVEKVKKLRSEIIAYQNANTKAMKDNRTSSNGITYSAEINAMLAKLKTASSVTDAEFKKISASFRSLKAEIKSVGLEGGTVFSGLIANIKKFTSWMSMTFLISRFTMEVRQAVVELKEIDTVLTEISKTSDRTTESLEKLGKTSFDTASKYGQKASDYLLGVQEMSRAGFGETESENMAELSTLAQSAGNMTAELANEYLIATNVAYKLNGSVNALTNVLDSQNYVTNRNAVNLTELANATKIAGSQSAVSAVGIDKMTAAVGTMIASTQEGGEVAGRAFKAILMNLQQVSAEADDIGDGGEAITSDSLTKYEKACADLGVSLKTVKDGALSLRDPMEILEELANSVSQEAEGSVKVANLINAVGGKYRGNQLISLLRNWDTYKKMLSEFNSDEAIGSAAEEAQKTAESWQGMLNALENDWSEFINTIVNSDIAKSIIESARRIISSLSDSTSVLDKGISFLTKGEVSTSLEFVLKQISNLIELATKFTDKIGLIPTILGGLALKNVGELSLKYARFRITTDIRCGECNTF